MSTPKKRGLSGSRGLDVLLGSVRQTQQDLQALTQEPLAETALKQLPIEQLSRGVYQPRLEMAPEALDELAQSIKAQGIIQPLVVRAVGPQRYEIIAGERRWRAAQIAGLDVVPALVREIDDETAIALALIENIQREDLNPLEEALAMQRFAEEFGLTHQAIAEAVGKSRTAVSNLLRLLALPEAVKQALSHGDLDMGHARALLALPSNEQNAAARHVIDRGLTVRQTEDFVRQRLAQPTAPAATKPRVNADVLKLQNSLSERLGASVRIDQGARGKGKLVISYNSLDELDGILAHIR